MTLVVGSSYVRGQTTEETEKAVRALIAGGGMAGLMSALALRESGAFTAIDVFEQTPVPSTAGAGLNIPPNAARLSRWLGVDLDGGDPQGPHGAIDGGRAAILHETRMVWPDGSITRKARSTASSTCSVDMSDRSIHTVRALRWSSLRRR